MQDTQTLVKLDQEDKNKAHRGIQLEHDKAITQLQQDILDQNDVNNSQANQITHLEDLVTELADRLLKLENNTKESEQPSTRNTRATGSHP
jgi:uncharacterized membrane protein YccC